MSGDIPGDERVVMAQDAGGGVASRATTVAVGAHTSRDHDPARTIHRYGRIHIVTTGRDAGAGTATRASEVPDAQRALLTPVETLGLDALTLRDSADFLAAKRDRPRDGEAWDLGRSCTEVVPFPPRPAPDTGEEALRARATDVTTPTSTASTSAYLEGSVAVGIIIVEGPTADLQFSAAERTKVAAEVQNGLSWYATTNPAADITFNYEISDVKLSVPASSSAADLEAVWRNPAMAQLGYAADFTGVYSYVDALRTRLGTRWSYAAFFTKYPTQWFAYSQVGGPRLVIQYANDGWGPDNIDRVFAHETGHIFGAVDEYTSSGCTCGGAWGRFGTPNGNCESCAASSLACLMKTNDFALCRFTPSHIGWAKGVRGNPALIQGTSGTAGNFELATPSAFDGIDHLWRDNDLTGDPWEAPVQFAQAAGPADALTMIQSRLVSPPSLEMVARYGQTLSFLWRDGGPTYRWREPTPIGTGAAGIPSLIQGRLGTIGNFELVVPAATGGLMHLWRNNSAAGYPWSAPTHFGTSLGQVDAASMIQSTLGGGNLEVAVTAGGALYSLWRDGGPPETWHDATHVLDGVTGNPAMVQSTFGAVGNFELVVPAATGGLIHVWRDNSAAGYPWSAPTHFGTSLGKVDAVSMIQSNLGGGSLEVVARVGDRLYAFWRQASLPYAWFGPTRIL
jgi:hypothetical protein